MQWQWKGPIDGGVTQSLLQKYLQDPFSFVLYYGLGLEEPAVLNQNLIWGNMFHLLLEHTLEMPTLYNDLDSSANEALEALLTKEMNKYLHINATTYHSVLQMMKLYDDRYKLAYEIETERQFKLPYKTKNHTVSLMGKMDGLGHRRSMDIQTDVMGLNTEYSTILVEHKCKGYHDKLQHRQEIHTDLQLNLYLHAADIMGFDVSQVVYDIIRIPEDQWYCPGRQAGERIKFYIERLYNNCTPHKDFPVVRNKMFWLDQHIFTHPREKVTLYRKEVMDPIIDSLCYMYEYTLADSFDPLNPDCFNHLFHKKPLRLFDPARTSSFKKDFYNYLTGQIDISGLVKVPQLFKELKDQE
jgi:PD-(D/E)XK nuclease superfamily